MTSIQDAQPYYYYYHYVCVQLRLLIFNRNVHFMCFVTNLVEICDFGWEMTFSCRANTVLKQPES